LAQWAISKDASGSGRIAGRSTLWKTSSTDPGRVRCGRAPAADFG
jgi:hypothetical protein